MTLALCGSMEPQDPQEEYNLAQHVTWNLQTKGELPLENFTAQDQE